MTLIKIINQPEEWLPEHFKYHFPCPIRFGDTDVAGHVNNAVYLTYFEVALTFYFSEVLKLEILRETSFVLARNEVNYMKPVYFGESVTIALEVVSMGAKSIEFAFLLFSGNEIKATGRNRMVCFDFIRRESKAIPQKLREKINCNQNLAIS